MHLSFNPNKLILIKDTNGDYLTIYGTIKKTKYKGYTYTTTYDNHTKTFFGTIDNITDLIMFEGNSQYDLYNAFCESVDDYIEICKKLKKNIK